VTVGAPQDLAGQTARVAVEGGGSYTDVRNLDGGMVAWQAAGKPLLNQEQK
jgi:rhodanese-related sulfurtransferase